MERRPTPEQSPLRNEREANELINAAIKEVTDLFGTEMSARDREMLTAVIEERSTDPIGRVNYLLQTQQAVGVSEDIKAYINHVLQTLRQKFTPEEQERFKVFGGSMLQEIN